MKAAIGILAAACLLVGAETPGAAQDLDGTLKRVKESGVFTIGYRDSSLPLSYLHDKLLPVGLPRSDALKRDIKEPNDKPNS